MAEAHDRRIRNVVARTPIPVLVVGVGAELHHAERHGGARVRMAVAARADETRSPGASGLRSRPPVAGPRIAAIRSRAKPIRGIMVVNSTIMRACIGPRACGLMKPMTPWLSLLLSGLRYARAGR